MAHRHHTLDRETPPTTFVALMIGQSFRLNEPDVTFEGFDGEVLLINLANGNYYSLRGSAVGIWPWLLEGHTVSAMAGAVASLCDTPIATLETDIKAFVDQLLAQDLITPRDDAPTSDIDTTTAKLDAYASPSVEAYTDMQDLLLLDPIHEVDVTGWPKKPAEE